MDTIQFEELKKRLTAIEEKVATQADRVSVVVKLKGEVFKVDEMRVTTDVPHGNNPHEWAIEEAKNLITKSKEVQGLASGVNGTNTAPLPIPQFNNQSYTQSKPKDGKIVNGLCTLCGGHASLSAKGNQYCKCWYAK